MDGNGRWAKNQGEDRLYGHHRGVESVRSVVDTAAKLGVRYLTIYAFSTENWGRPEPEVSGLMELLGATILNETEALFSEGVHMRFIGRTDQLSETLRKNIALAESRVPDKVKMTLVIALNYGSREEIAGACRTIAEEVATGKLAPEQIDNDTISQHLYTAAIPDPELLVRTSGEQRLSNFLLWQLSYSELYFTPVLWPEFDGEQLTIAIREYNRRERRFGRVETI